MGPMLGGIKEAANLWSFWGSDFPKTRLALSLGPGVIWWSVIYNLKFVIKTDSSIGGVVCFWQISGYLFLPPKKETTKLQHIFCWFWGVGFDGCFFNIKNHHGQPLGGHRVSVRGGLEKPSFGMGQSHGKNRQQINMSSIEELGFFFKSKVVLKNPHFVNFSGKSRKKHTNSMDRFGYLVSLTASKERISRLFSPGFQNRRERRPVKWCSAFIFWRLYKNPLGNLSNNFQ